MVRVKVCGITNFEDALMAVELGVHALGFIFAPSPRQVTPETVRKITDALPPFIQSVGVFVNEDLVTIRETKGFCRLDMVQLHGEESPGFCREFMPQAIKAFRLQDGSSLSPIKSYVGQVRAVLLDTHERAKKGGTGKCFDWDLALKTKELGLPIILSGGLGPLNIQPAIRTVRPYGVDVNSGIESCPGKKSHLLMKALMEAIRAIDMKGLGNGC
jgi:phosphoribosylanthranilate isomerase